MGRVDTTVSGMSGAVEYHRTISEADVVAFAAATGDDNRVHMDREYSRSLGMAHRVAHGILIQGLMSTACTRWAERAGLNILSYGWDRVRFVKPVLLGDTITTAYALVDPEDAGRKRLARADAHNQRGELVGVGTHVLYVLD
jgi:acyl dehydratase